MREEGGKPGEWAGAMEGVACQLEGDEGRGQAGGRQGGQGAVPQVQGKKEGGQSTVVEDTEGREVGEVEGGQGGAAGEVGYVLHEVEAEVNRG